MYVLKEKQFVGGELREAGTDITQIATTLELDALVANDKVEIVLNEENAPNVESEAPSVKQKQDK